MGDEKLLIQEPDNEYLSQILAHFLAPQRGLFCSVKAPGTGTKSLNNGHTVIYVTPPRLIVRLPTRGMMTLQCENYFTTVPQVVGTNTYDHEKINNALYSNFAATGNVLCYFSLLINGHAAV